MKKLITSLLLLCILSCSKTISSSGDATEGYGAGISETTPDTTGTVTTSDPDGITGNGSTYGTGTGVSGQTPTGIGSGTGNTGRSGVGVREP